MRPKARGLGRNRANSPPHAHRRQTTRIQAGPSPGPGRSTSVHKGPSSSLLDPSFLYVSVPWWPAQLLQLASRIRVQSAKESPRNHCARPSSATAHSTHPESRETNPAISPHVESVSRARWRCTCTCTCTVYRVREHRKQDTRRDKDGKRWGNGKHGRACADVCYVVHSTSGGWRRDRPGTHGAPHTEPPSGGEKHGKPRMSGPRERACETSLRGSAGATVPTGLVSAFSWV